jgi:hypothetical protein
VYLSKDPSGPDHKFKYKYTGPYAVDKCNSPHLITLKDPMTGKNLPSPVHINRLKMAYVRKPTPMNYFLTIKMKSKTSLTTYKQNDV